jgi:two-component system CheB/CheR fusion protein
MVRNARSPKSARRRSAATPVSERVPVVGVGASAGGVKALQTFFDAMPATLGVAFVVIVHLDPDARSELAEILGARSQLRVHQVTASTPLNADCIYVIPPDRELHITDDEIAARAFAAPRGHRAPIDMFFRSLAEQRGDGFAVILTGAGSDGAIGVKAVKESGGIILVQDPEEAEYPSMPRAAVATGAADIVAPVGELAHHLVDLIRTKSSRPALRGAVDEEEGLRRILAHLRVRTGHDFSHYKITTVTRRVQRRMQVARKEKLADYFAYLRETPDEAQALLADLLISVTTFFRDGKAFDALAREVLPNLFEEKRLADGIRVWAAGCATGEEAYSLAMLLLEEAARHDLRPEIQVFGSDMDLNALSIAREGRYPATIEADVSEERLRRFFTRDGDHYRVKRELRDVVLFAHHSVLKDPPFSRVGLISCRNLLIYLNRELQHQVLATLHYGLTPDGYLFLGSSESADHSDGLFLTVDREARIYRSAGRSSERLPTLPRLQSAMIAERTQGVASFTPSSARNAMAAHREALESLAPPSIMVDESNHVIHLSETAGRFLQPSGGPLTSDLTDLVRQELRFELRSALNRAFERDESVLTGPIPVRFNGSPVRVHLQVRPIRREARDGQRALVLFIEGEKFGAPIREGQEAGATSEVVARLKQELEIAQLRLRTTHEESETANEELRAANEELQSINEEYRSTAEELETSKEELQSINEELQTVNSELKLKLETVSRANSDLQNLMAAMDFGILFLDSELRIKRFTPRLADLFSITANDVGRSITDFAHQLDYEGLPRDAIEVLENLTPVEREIRSRAGGWYLVRFRPYRTVDDKIDGVVASFVDITERRRMEAALRANEDKLRQEMRLVELSRSPIIVWDFDDGVLQWNRGSEELYGYERAEVLGRDKAALLKTTVPGSSFEAVRAALLEAGAWQGELNQVAKDGRRLITEARIEMISVGDKRYVLESARDVTQSSALVERQHLLLNELTHRVKNTLTVIQSMVHQTWRSSASREEFVERIDGRIAALANSHKLLVDSEWEGADLHSLVESQVLHYAGDAPKRVRISGPPTRLPPHVATPLGLVLHELATNAAKYGALSTPTGSIDLKWRVEARNPKPFLVVAWEEAGGPPIRNTSRLGFGSRLIRQGIPGSVVRHEFVETGVICVAEIPLASQEIDA